MSEPIPALPDQPVPEPVLAADLPIPEAAPAVAPEDVHLPPGPTVLIRFSPDASAEYPVQREELWWHPGSEYALSHDAAARLATEAGFAPVGSAPPSNP
jgi:hypothetical protein